MFRHNLTYQIEMITHTCIECGCLFGITSEMDTEFRRNGKDFSCPNGHKQSYKESEIETVKKQLEAANKELDAKKMKLAEVERDLASLQMHQKLTTKTNLNTWEACEFIDVSYTKLLKLAKDKRITKHKNGSKVYYRRSELEVYLKGLK